MEPAVKKALRPYESSAMPNIPGTGNIFTIPMDIAGCYKSIRGALRVRDKEAYRDAMIRSIGLPFNAANSIGQNVEMGVSLGLIPTDRFAIFGKLSAILGIVFCLIEGILESVHIYRQKKFTKKLAGHESLLDKMKYIQHKYIAPPKTQKTTARHIRLARLLRPWAAEQLIQEVPKVRKLLSSKDWYKQYLGEKQAQEILQFIDEQTEKKIKFHALGIATLITSLLGLALMLAPIPLVWPSLFITAGIVMGIGRYILHKGFYDSEGWKFKKEACFPEFINRHLFPKKPLGVPIGPAPYTQSNSINVSSSNHSFNDACANASTFHFNNSPDCTTPR